MLYCLSTQMEAVWEKADSTRQSANGTIGECLGELFMNVVYEMMLLSIWITKWGYCAVYYYLGTRALVPYSGFVRYSRGHQFAYLLGSPAEFVESWKIGLLSSLMESRSAKYRLVSMTMIRADILIVSSAIDTGNLELPLTHPRQSILWSLC